MPFDPLLLQSPACFLEALQAPWGLRGPGRAPPSPEMPELQKCRVCDVAGPALPSPMASAQASCTEAVSQGAGCWGDRHGPGSGCWLGVRCVLRTLLVYRHRLARQPVGTDWHSSQQAYHCSPPCIHRSLPSSEVWAGPMSCCPSPRGSSPRGQPCSGSDPEEGVAHAGLTKG